MFRNPTTDLIVVLVIVLLFFGPKRLPALGRDLGAGLREFKDSITGGNKDDEADDQPALQPGEGSPAQPVQAPQPAASSSAPAESAGRPD